MAPSHNNFRFRVTPFVLMRREGVPFDLKESALLVPSNKHTADIPEDLLIKPVIMPGLLDRGNDVELPALIIDEREVPRTSRLLCMWVRTMFCHQRAAGFTMESVEVEERS